MSSGDDRHLHSEIGLMGFRSRAAVAGLLQLVKELRGSGALGEEAVNRIRDTVVDELSLMRPRHVSREEVRSQLKVRLDKLVRGDDERIRRE